MVDDTSEMLEVLDDSGQPLGTTKPRGQMHRDGDWHRAFHLWVLHADGYVLLQRRASGKDLAGGRVDVSVAGHVRPGETLLDMLREAEEEIGLTLRPGDVAFLETIRSERHYPRGVVDREFQDVYVTVVEGRALRDYALDCREVSVLYEAPLARARAFFELGGPLAVAGWDCQRRRSDALLVEQDVIAQARAETAASLARVERWWLDRAA